MNPRYACALQCALKSLERRREGKHGLNLQEIARTFSGEWALAADEEANLLLHLDKWRDG